MPREAGRAGSPREWIRYAEADLDLARMPLSRRGLYEHLCFHAQQAAEKSLKAVLVHLGIDFPATHNLQRLIDLLPEEVARTAPLLAAARLTAYAVSSRYPSEEEAVQEEEYHDSLHVAETVLEWAVDYLGLKDAD